ncbi:MAG: bifunctional 4-hydroxy-2-oxoglutarate aldolase/2-dehydro-3-deoxy-phosphogluconate aldolase [Coxiellaceae bacterium]|nr:bifunctional 4-hydroxy-2-oxoglutarate aldolase/2-dehydro-3-deoxy-phosphogluconate aldolase [Coxiellaceae bacterium]
MPAIIELLQQHRIIPVIAIDQADDIVPLAQALMEGGIHCLEITLRTDAAMAAIALAKQQFPDLCIAAGTVVTVDQVLALQALDVDFVVSPGNTAELMAATEHLQMPYLPGVMTPSEVMKVAEHGLACAKLFPANLAGGHAALKNYQALFNKMHFCPTGGINADNCQSYLEMPNVMSIGGSWLTPRDLIQSKNWSAITQLAKQALALV